MSDADLKNSLIKKMKELEAKIIHCDVEAFSARSEYLKYEEKLKALEAENIP